MMSKKMLQSIHSQIDKCMNVNKHKTNIGLMLKEMNNNPSTKIRLRDVLVR